MKAYKKPITPKIKRLLNTKHKCNINMQDLSNPSKVFRTVWISDFHLGTKGSQAKELLSFLRYTDAEKIYLVGDIVDGWQLSKRWHWPQAHNDVVQKILEKAKNGRDCFHSWKS